MNTHVNRQWRIARRPVGLAKESDFEWREESVPVPGPGQVLVKNHHLSLDPSTRAWMWQEDTYLPAQKIGAVMRGMTLGTVEKSHNSAFPEGTAVMGALGWQDYTVTDGASDLLSRLHPDSSISPIVHFGLLGHVGMAAYFGLLEIGKPKSGETLVVSSAAGAVGSLVGQIGKLYGCRVVGIAGTDAKCRWITGELGFDAAVNYKSESVYKRLAQYCPGGIDIYFDNVGGVILEDVLNLLNLRARIVGCGMVSVYNDVGGSLTFPPGPNNLLHLIHKRAKVEGFVYLDYTKRAAEAIEALAAWHKAGKIQYRVNVVDGLHNAPRALNKLFDGSNSGKLVIKM